MNPSPKQPKSGMARLLEIAATKKPLIISAVIFAAFASIAGFLPYLAIFRIVQAILTSLPSLSGLDSARLIRLGWLAFGGAILNILLYLGALACSHLAAFGTLYMLKVNFASHLARVPLGFHVMVGSGKLRKIVDENIEKVEGFIAHQLPDLVASFVAPVVMIIILLSVDWRLGLAAMVGVLLAFAAQFSLYGNENSKKMMREYQASIEDMNNAAVEYVRGISVVKAFRQTVYSFRRLHETIKSYTTMVISYTMSWKNSFAGFVTLVNNIYLFIVPVGILIGMRSADYTAFASSFVFYLLFVPSIASVLMKIMYVSSNSMSILNGVEAMDNLLASPVLPQPEQGKTTKAYDVTFDNVHFAYGEDENVTALRGVSFAAHQGRITAIVGPSGGGKSTIAHLIPRFFDVQQGRISIGGVDVRDLENSYLMGQVSFVFQDVFLFKQSVMNNIRMGNPSATDADVAAAARAAQCHEFIMQLPQGYQTVIGTRGVHLSGGEKQRIAIARAIVKDAPIVVLDEATAFSDPENEHLIQLAFEKLMRDKTVIMIAHRLSTVQGAHSIIVVDNGEVIQQGTHDALLKAGGKYADMWQAYQLTSTWRFANTKEVAQGAY